MTGAVLAFCGLWGVPYLGARYQLSPSTSAAITSGMMLAWALAGPLLGALSDGIGRRKLPYLAATITAALGWAAALYLPSLPLVYFVVIATLAAVASGALIVGFAFSKESVPAELAGTVSGICNMGSMSGPMVLQPAIGWMLDLQWEGTMQNGVRLYEASAYQWSFLLMVGWMMVAALLTLFTTETWCRQHSEDKKSRT
jgi:MFS family permease